MVLCTIWYEALRLRIADFTKLCQIVLNNLTGCMFASKVFLVSVRKFSLGLLSYPYWACGRDVMRDLIISVTNSLVIRHSESVRSSS